MPIESPTGHEVSAPAYASDDDPLSLDLESPPAVRLSRVGLMTGISLEVAQAGLDTGDPVLFLHGFTDSWFSFERVLERLPHGIRAIVPSQRGHGESDRPHGGYRRDHMAADAVALLDALGVDRAAVVGHSMGSLVAQCFALHWPERLDRLVLIGSAPSFHTVGLSQLNEEVQRLLDPVPRRFIEEFQYSTVAISPPAAFMGRVIAESEKLPARVWHQVLPNLMAMDFRQELPRIEAPTLLCWGDRDAVFSAEDQEGLLDAIPDSVLLVYSGVGHSPHWEQPARFVSDLIDFLDAGR